MKFVIPGNNLKVFSKAIHCLAKLGNEIYFECDNNSLTLKTVSMSRSAFATCKFSRRFFNDVCATGTAIPYSENSNLKVSTKTLLHIFRSLSTIERTVNTCDIEFISSKDCITITFVCKYDITKSVNMFYQECDALDAVFFKELCPNKLTALAKLLLDVNANFPQNLEEITLTLNTEKVVLSSYGSDDHQNKEMRTEMTLDPQEFEDFSVGIDTQISFSLKDLRAILSFAEACSSNCQLHFESNGKPLIIAFEHPNLYSVNFVIATYSEELISHSQMPSNKNSKPKKLKRKDSSHRISPQSKNQSKNAGNITNDSMQMDTMMDSVLILPPNKRVRDVLFDNSNIQNTSNSMVLAPDSEDDSS